MKAAFYTLGCKVNQYETEYMKELLEEHGYTIVDDAAGADVCVINSCTVTAESNRKSRQSVRRFRKLNPDGILVFTGCVPQAFPEENDAMPEADILLGNNANHLLPEVIEEYRQTGERIVRCLKHEDHAAFRSCSISRFMGRTRATVKIEDGCNRFCSYCIIPYARGRVRSKPLEELRQEIAALEGAGFREIVLVGINLSAYGSDIGCSLCDAVELCAAFDGIARVRLGSLEPDLLTQDVIERLSKVEKLCPQFHISLQSGCDATLRRMRRRYTSAEYLALCQTLRRRFPDAAITTDVMVGFSGETEEDFEDSLRFVQTVGFEKVHVFPYSPRKGTAAYDLPQVPQKEKIRRSHRMMAAAEELRKTYLSAQIGKTVEVLMEEFSDGCAAGYTVNYTPVKVPSAAALDGIRRVQIVDADAEVCIGTLTGEN